MVHCCDAEPNQAQRIIFSHFIWSSFPQIITTKIWGQRPQDRVKGHLMQYKARESTKEMSQPLTNNHTMEEYNNIEIQIQNNANSHNTIIRFTSNMPDYKAFWVTAKYLSKYSNHSTRSHKIQTLDSSNPQSSRNPKKNLNLCSQATKQPRYFPSCNYQLY